ncbi:hypothetical protein, partial [Burkholderia stabilis]
RSATPVSRAMSRAASARSVMRRLPVRAATGRGRERAASAEGRFGLAPFLDFSGGADGAAEGECPFDPVLHGLTPEVKTVRSHSIAPRSKQSGERLPAAQPFHKTYSFPAMRDARRTVLLFA